MTLSLPLYAWAGVSMAAATLAGLVWVRLRGPRAEASESRLPQAGTDHEALFSLSPHPMFVYAVDSLRLLAANEAAVRRYGFSQREFLQMGLADICLVEDAPHMKAMAQESQKLRSATLPGIWRHRRKDNALLHVRLSSHELAFDGRAARLMQAMDVSAEVALEAEREQMIAKLQHSREWLATAINAGRIALWERDLVARTLVLGGRWAEMMGSTPQAFGPVTEQSFDQIVHPDDAPRVTERFIAYLKNPSTPFVDEFRIKHAHEGWIWVLCRGKLAERSSDGRARRVVGTYADISDVKAAQSARAQQQAAEQASTMKSHFLGRVSHELRTPLNAVIGFSQLMQLDAEAPLTPQQAERVGRIEHAGQHLLSLISDLMDLSRVELGAVELNFESLDLPELLSDSLAMVETQLQERQITLKREIDPGLPRVVADPLRLRQCVLNLLTNAIKYNETGGTVRVGARATRRGGVELTVWNSGIGMTPEQLARLYEPFNRLGRDTSHSEGTGIGLAISRQLIERMGGSIEASARTGEWAQFCVVLRGAPSREPTPTR